MAPIHWDILETQVVNPTPAGQSFGKDGNKMWCDELVKLGLMKPPEGDFDYQPTDKGRRLIRAFYGIWEPQELCDVDLGIDYARDPMFANLGDCQSPSVKRLREETCPGCNQRRINCRC
jgi:hypothetical protein